MRPGVTVSLVALAACSAPRTAPLPTAGSQAALATALARIEAHDEPGAIPALDRAIELDPSNAAALRWRGHCLNWIGSFEDALADYDRAIEIDPGFAWTHYARGMANHNLGRYELAIAGYTRSIELDPRFLKAWQWRGFTRKLVRDHAGAASDLDHSLAVAPDDPWTLAESAKVHVALGDLDRAERNYRRLLELDPHDTSAGAALGFLASVRGDLGTARDRLEAACAAHAPEETYARVWLWFQETDHEAADRDLAAWFADARIDDPWEVQLVAFLLGEGDESALTRAAEAEMGSRVARGVPADFLDCEAAFYSAIRCARRGERSRMREFAANARALGASEAWEWHAALALLLPSPGD